MKVLAIPFPSDRSNYLVSPSVTQAVSGCTPLDELVGVQMPASYHSLPKDVRDAVIRRFDELDIVNPEDVPIPASVITQPAVWEFRINLPTKAVR